jgi:glycolate oxidase
MDRVGRVAAAVFSILEGLRILNHRGQPEKATVHDRIGSDMTLNSPTISVDELLEKLREIYPTERLLTKRGQLAAYESDGLTIFQSRPLAVVVPNDAEEISATLKLCQTYGVPFVPRGSGTSLSGGCVPHAQGIVIALNRMNRILQVDPVQCTAVVEPGVINLEISKAAAHFGLYYAPDPSSQQICTLGGNLAFNAGGAHCLKYGMTSNHVLGAKVVLPDGEIVSLGDASLEHVGPDLMGMFVGSEGLFGIAVEITVRLLPKPTAFHTVLAGYPSLKLAGDAVAQIVASGLLPGALEIMDSLSMEAATRAVGVQYPPGAKAVLIVELDGTTESVEIEKLQLQRLLEASAATATLVAANPEQRATIWKGRKSAFSAVGLISPDFLVQDCVVPRTKLGQVLEEIEQLSLASGLRVANVFHAGDGNLHPLILFDGRDEGALAKAEALSAKIIRLCIQQGGSITGEHGVGMEKREFMPDLFGNSDVEFMQQLRRAMDPNEISNRGKMFPDGEAPALRLVGLHPLESQGIASRM